MGCTQHRLTFGGILGQNFLLQFDYIMDFEKRELVLGRRQRANPRFRSV